MSGIHAYLNSHRNTSTLSSVAEKATETAKMPAHTDFVKNNEEYVAAFGEKGALPLKPGKQLAIGV